VGIIDHEKEWLRRSACAGKCSFCSSVLWISYPDFHPSRIPDTKTATKERGENKFVVIPFFVATKLKIILFLKC
jgi:hypothetical protein